MKKRPLPVVLVAMLYIVMGCIGFVYHLTDLAEPDISTAESVLVLCLRVLAVAIGILLLYRKSWARWLAIAWLAYHVVIGAFHSTSEMMAHIGFLIVVSLLLFSPVSGRYFRGEESAV